MRIPPGLTEATPYLSVPDAAAYIAFLQAAFGWTEAGRTTAPDGRIRHAELRLGAAALMLHDALPDYPASRTGFYLYVADADAAQQRALAAGAVQIAPVDDKPYGDRQGGVTDPAGNTWWISQRITDGPHYP